LSYVLVLEDNAGDGQLLENFAAEKKQPLSVGASINRLEQVN
jgi:hypothetical protein